MTCSLNSTNSNENTSPEYYTDTNEIIKKLVKYLIEGFVIVLVLRWLPKNNLNFNEIATITLTITATLIMLDSYSPTVSTGYRNGIGLALGAKTIFM